MPTPAEDAQYLVDLAWEFQTAERSGAELDEPEGLQYITLSHTFAVKLSVELDAIGNRICNEPGCLVPTVVAEELDRIVKKA